MKSSKTKTSEKDKEQLLNDLKSFLYNNDKNNEIICKSICFLYGLEFENEEELIFEYILNKYSNDLMKKLKKNLKELPINKIINVILNFQTNLQDLQEGLNNIKNIISFEAPPFKVNKNIEYNGEYVFSKDPIVSNAYYSSIKNTFETEEADCLLTELLIKNETGFFDIIPLPLPFDSDLRKKWSTNDNFNISGKPLTVHLFEWALIDFLNKINFEKVDISDLNFALGMPTNTSVSILDYYSENELKISRINKSFKISEKNECGTTLSSIKSVNSIDSKVGKNTLKGMTIPLFKSNVVGSSNFPNSELIKLAFNLM